MVRYKKRILFLNIEESWFDGTLRLKDIFSFKVIYHLKEAKKMFAIRQTSHTIELNLTEDTQTIYSNFTKSYRQQVRKAEAEGITSETCRDVNVFVDFFNNFAAKKGTYITSRDRVLEKGDFLQIHFARHEGNILAAHSYLVDKEKKIVRHYQTATRRLDNDFNSSFVGQANKYLLVNSMMKYKAEGYEVFDFGGYAANTKDESLQGINNYKIKFGGQIVECSDYFTFLYWITKKAAALIGKQGSV